MSAVLKIFDENSLGEVIAENTIEFPSHEITVRDLIESRVREEVRAFNQTKTEKFLGLVQPKDTETILNGFKFKKTRQVNPEQQVKVAIDAFQQNGFFILVNDRQLTELDDQILIAPNTKTVFLKLISLVGG